MTLATTVGPPPFYRRLGKSIYDNVIILRNKHCLRTKKNRPIRLRDKPGRLGAWHVSRHGAPLIDGNVFSALKPLDTCHPPGVAVVLSESRIPRFLENLRFSKTVKLEFLDWGQARSANGLRATKFLGGPKVFTSMKFCRRPSGFRVTNAT